MGKSKKYFYDYEDFDSGKGSSTLLNDILEDSEFPSVTELIIGNWGDPWEDACQEIIDGIVENKEKFSHVESLFIGDMEFDECEVSWIMQGDYSRLYEAMPQLKALTIKGSADLELGKISHENLEELTIICGGLPSDVIESIKTAHLPKLKKLLLYIGVEEYGFDGTIGTIRSLLEHSDFPSLTYLGLTDSEIQNEVTELVLNSRYMEQLETLDLSCGTLSDEGGAMLLEKLPNYPKLKKLDVHYHYLSDNMVKKLEALPIEVDASEQNEADEDDGEIWMYPMLTE